MTEKAAQAIGNRIRGLLGPLTDAEISTKSSRAVTELAEAVHKTPDTIYKMLRGETVTRWVTLAEYARALRTTPNYILGFSEDPSDKSHLGEGRAFELILQEVIGVALQMVGGLDPAEAKILANTLLEVARKPPDPSVSASAQDQIRFRAEGVIHALWPPKPQ